MLQHMVNDTKWFRFYKQAIIIAYNHSLTPKQHNCYDILSGSYKGVDVKT